LKEVVVIGTLLKESHDSRSVEFKKLRQCCGTQPADLLRGVSASYTVSGEPGAGASIRIRGNSSIRSGNGPLIVVDGVPLDGRSSTGSDIGLGGSSARNPLNFINQNDIESLTVLKDASSTAIYGSRELMV
jgi:iron complex outermembrane receptor protein